MRTWNDYTPASVCERASILAAAITHASAVTRERAALASRHGDAEGFNAAVRTMTRLHRAAARVARIFHREMAFLIQARSGASSLGLH